MHNIYVKTDLNINHNLKTGFVTLVGRTGHCYVNKAIDIPGYGLIPCSQKLIRDFTTDPSHLVLVISDPDDDDPPYTSSIWVSRTDVEYLPFDF